MADEIKTCGDLDERLASYVDGEASAESRRLVDAHLAKCPECRDAAHAEAVEQAAADIEGAQSPEQILARATLDADLQAALDGLPDAFRQAVWLRDVEELSYADMAKVLDIPIGTVMSRISRGRRALFTALQGTRGTAERHVASR